MQHIGEVFMKIAKKIISTIIVVGSLWFSHSASAGLTFFSRANCVNNESISWDWPGNNWWLWTFSQHYNFRTGAWEPVLSTGWEYTYRSAAVHWGEGFSGNYFVQGDHYMWISGYGTLYLGKTQTQNCNLGYFFPYWS